MANLFTVGHSTHPLAEFLDMLGDNGVEHLVDVRKLPGSRRFPHFDQDALRDSRAGAGIGYDWVEPLTGRRKVSTTVPFEVNAFWNNRSFHNYADHALSEEFVSAVETLVDAPRATVLLCSEAVWWRCHRRIITDHLLARGVEVTHIMGPSQTQAATLTAGAVVGPDHQVTYPAT